MLVERRTPWSADSHQVEKTIAQLCFLKAIKRKQSIMKPIPQFQINLARIIPMISAEREAIVILDAPVRHVERRHRRSKPLTEILAHRKIKRRMLRQVIPRIGRARKSIAEARPVIN